MTDGFYRSHLYIQTICWSTSNRNTGTQNPTPRSEEVLILKGRSIIAPVVLDSLQGRDTPQLGLHWGSFSAGGNTPSQAPLISMVLLLRATVPCVCVSATHTQADRYKELLSQTHTNSVYSCKLFSPSLWIVVYFSIASKHCSKPSLAECKIYNSS